MKESQASGSALDPNPAVEAHARRYLADARPARQRRGMADAAAPER